MTEASHLAALESVALSDSAARAERVLEVAREALAMEIAYFSEFADDRQRVQRTSGDTDSFGFGAGTDVLLDETYCKRMVAGQIPNLIPDTHAHAGVRDLPATAEGSLRAYIGVPVNLSDGRVYGTLCCASRQPTEVLGDRDVSFLRVLARMLADELERLSADVSTSRPSDADVLARLNLWFAGSPRAAPAARAALKSLSDHVSEDVLYQLNLVVTELVTNSVRHAGIGPASSVALEVTVLPELIVGAVTDPGDGFEYDVAEAVDLMDEGGRGLFLVDQIAARWGVETGTGTRVWFEMSAA